jgi:hypothetical protein
MKRLKEAEEASKAKEKSTFGGLFSKVKMYDDKEDNVVVPSGNNPKVQRRCVLCPYHSLVYLLVFPSLFLIGLYLWR